MGVIGWGGADRRRRTPAWGLALLPALLALAWLAPGSALAAKTRMRAHAAHQAASSVRRFGELDCNNDSPVQQAVRPTMNCTDIRGFANVDNQNTWGGRFYDNGYYIGHDEPDMTFYSSAPGSGDTVSWSETLPHDPAAAPTVTHPGSDVVHWFELSVAPWFSMAMCDPNSYPQSSCTPQSDVNAPTCVGTQTTNCYPGGGSAFMEMQFYPPGFAPFADSISCDNTHWCAALTIDSLECTLGFATCNPNCVEPVNFAFIQTNGVPTGPASPQEADLATFTPNADTLLMNPGDKLTIQMSDQPVPHQRRTYAFEVVIHDLTTGQTGYMQASAANGFQNTSISDCSGTPFNFQPEYDTAKPANVVPWAALQTDISTEYETGHFEPCTSVTGASSYPLSATISDTFYNNCHGPYEAAAAGGDGSNQAEVSDALCYPQGDTHGALDSAPDTVTGCLADYAQNGDLDFDGTPYWADWPTSTMPTPTFPGSFTQSLPASGRGGYAQYMIQTDTALSESTCAGPAGPGCAIPPPNAPGQFYPFWSRVSRGGSCTLEFGNVTSGPGVSDLGGDAQYGSDQYARLGYPEFEGPVLSNSTCT
jgi:hypothetical protein